METIRRTIENVEFKAPRQETTVELMDGRKVTLPPMWDYKVAKRVGCSTSTVRRAVETPQQGDLRQGDLRQNRRARGQGARGQMTEKARMARMVFIEMFLLNQ